MARLASLELGRAEQSVLERCGQRAKASCAIDGTDTLTTVYDYTPPGDVDCTADCNIVVADCRSPSSDTMTHTGDVVDVTTVPDCDPLF